MKFEELVRNEKDAVLQADMAAKEAKTQAELAEAKAVALAGMCLCSLSYGFICYLSIS